MKNLKLGSCVLALLAFASIAADAKPLPAKLLMPGGRSWTGTVVGRDGDWIEFSTGPASNPIRVGASTIEQLDFTLTIDMDALQRMQDERLYEAAITALETALKPYAEYADIPSNLTACNALLMELYFKTDNLDKVLSIAETLSQDERNPELQRKSVVYQGMALLEAGRVEEAEVLFEKQGWTTDLSDDAPAEDLYIVSKFLMAKKDYSRALEMAAKVVAFHSQDPEWVRPAELLCAELYTELGMPESAAEVIREISLLYKNSDEDLEAQKLKVRVDAMLKELEVDQDLFGSDV